MKVDQEFLVKNHFWLLLGTAVTFTLIGWILVVFGVPATVSGERDKVWSEWDNKKKYTEFKSPKAVEMAKAVAEARDKERGSVHSVLYNTQAKEATLMSFPTRMEQEFDPRTGRYALEVVIHPAKTSLSSLGKDDDTHLYGTLTGNVDAASFEIKGQGGKIIKLVKTPNIKINESGNQNSVNFGNLGQQYRNRPVAVTYTVGHYFGDDFTDAELRLF